MATSDFPTILSIGVGEMIRGTGGRNLVSVDLSITPSYVIEAAEEVSSRRSLRYCRRFAVPPLILVRRFPSEMSLTVDDRYSGPKENLPSI